MAQKDIMEVAMKSQSGLSGMKPRFSVSVCGYGSVSGRDTNRPSYLTSSTPTCGECTLEFSQQSKHIGGLFLTPASCYKRCPNVILSVFYIPSYHYKRADSRLLETVSVTAFFF